MEDEEIRSREEAHEILEGTVIERDKFEYSFREYFTTWILKTYLCCCLKKSSNFWKVRKAKYERYGKAVKKMSKEVDVLNYIEN